MTGFNNLFLAVFGVIARKTGIFRAESKTPIIDMMLYITLPPLIFVSMATEISSERLLSGAYIPLFYLGLIILMFLVAYLLGPLKLVTKKRQKPLPFFVLPNSGFIGYPVTLAVLGETGFTYAVLYDIGVTIAFCLEKYGGDGEFAVLAVFFTTLLSLITIPLIFL